MPNPNPALPTPNSQTLPLYLPPLSPLLHPAGQWTPGAYRKTLIIKAKIALE